jgi:hypothetical protein
MDENSRFFDPRSLLSESALDIAMKVTPAEANEIWRVSQLVAAGKSLEGVPGAVIQIATDINCYPDAWKVIEEKALLYERNVNSTSH